MSNLLSQNLFTEGRPISLEKKPTWSFSGAGYEVTPPNELAEPDCILPCPAIDSIDKNSEPVVAVIGVGYVGEHLVTTFSNNYNVIGYDVSEARMHQLSQNQAADSRIRFTSNASDLAEATHFLISVPTLLLPDKTIDSSYLRSALATIGIYARRGATVVIESSVAVGMTRELLGPLAKARGYFAGMSPERVDPGRVEPPARAIPKVVSGLDDVVPGSLDAITRLYSQSFDQVIPVSQPEVAEMMKLYENCQRMVCIAYANEMADACLDHNIDPYEVCSAASTKPFGYLPFSPGLGVGGHCIPVNPWYLLSNSKFPLLQAASEKMAARPGFIAQRVIDRLDAQLPGSANPRVLVVGIGFKRGQSHLVNSPGLELAKRLVLSGNGRKVDVTWADPLVQQQAVPQIPRLADSDWTVEYLEENFDTIIVAMQQDGLDFSVIDCVRGVHVENWCA